MLKGCVLQPCLCQVSFLVGGWRLAEEISPEWNHVTQSHKLAVAELGEKMAQF